MKPPLACILLFASPAFAQIGTPHVESEAAATATATATAAPDAARPSASPPIARLRVALTSTSAFGLSNGRFFNELVGVRLDYRFGQRFAFGGALAYANLRGKDARSHNVLPEATLQYRVPIEGEHFGLPLRLGTGFLPRNGPTLRLSVGLDLALGKHASLELMPLEPMLWVTRERPEVSLNAALAFRLAF